MGKKIVNFNSKGIDNRPQYTKENNWGIWYRDVDIAEAIIIFKYSPHYNSAGLTAYPNLYSYKKFNLIHTGNKAKLKASDHAPSDYKGNKGKVDVCNF